LRAQEPDPDAPSPSGALPLYSDRAARSRMTRPTQHEFAGWSGEFAGKSGSQIDAPISGDPPARITVCAGAQCDPGQRRQPALVKFNQDRVSARFRQAQQRRTNCASAASLARQ
jgi:hypothetical protein